ncbi:MAG: HlyD family efflux transporter periplasmic adaptor subunit [Dehalococcoidia bacterium]|nr:MAG: HlyD family efflux transporter periplasmic adaptor subunit [Dehalococcoidia bacterium]
MKRTLITILIALIVVGLTVSSLGCSVETDEAEVAEIQIINVERGDLAIEITAVGNLALSHSEDLAFDLFYQEGTVEEVLVEEGDSVTEGQVLAKLDTEEWEDELSTLEDQVIARERDLVQAEINLKTAQQNLKNAQDNKEAKELALLNAQISLDQAEYNLSVAEETHVWPDLEIAEAEVEKAEAFLEYALDGGWESVITRAQAELDAAEREYNALVQGYDTEEVAIKKLQVESAKLALAQTEADLGEVAEDVALKELQLTLNQGKLEDAGKALIDAGEELEEARSKSPIIVAPFDGFITKVSVEGGDEVLSGTVAVQLADPEKFEADIFVGEMDITQVKLGGEAWVQVDAMSGLTLPAEVTHISPTATIQSGVVNYQVKVEIKSLEAVVQERQVARQEAMQEIEPGELPERLRQAIEEGQITQGQAEEMMSQRQQGRVPYTIPEKFQLREGLTVTVTIVVDEKTDVLLVPNSAITSRGGQTYIQVEAADGTLVDRQIQTGISDYQFTEVTGGLDEGEQVAVPQGIVATTTEQREPRGPMPFLPPPPR